ncbi:MAG: glycoside hydrolase family 3 N-terminal domain-containing protein [Bacteroidota bacterium]|jgi:beta-glucosidase
MKTIDNVVTCGRIAIVIGLVFTFSSFGQSRKTTFPYKNPSLPIAERVKDLLSRMTLEEKIAQLQCEIQDIEGKDSIITRGVGQLACTLRPLGPKEAAGLANKIQKLAVEKTRLGIPIIIHDEALHGLIGKGATSFPQAIGLAATWDPDLMERIATVIGKETRSRGVRQVLSPVINIARDVRWGRVEETYGEDPLLTSRMGVAFCKNIEAEGVVTTPKHFVANVGDGGRDSHPIEFSEALLREIYFPPFKACFQEGHATSVMAAYNSINEQPCSGNRWLLTDVLRNEWGFKGYVVSDYGSVGGILDLHHTAANLKEAGKQAVEAGLEVELPNIYAYGSPLVAAVKEGLVSEATIDTAVGRVLTAKFNLGLFEHPYVDPASAEKINNDPAHRSLALEAAHKAIVLLKNTDGFLPFKKDLKSIAVIGPDADTMQLGGYSGFGTKVVTLLEGIKNKVPQSATVSFAKGCDLMETGLPPVTSDHLVPPDGKPGEHGLKGEYFNNMDLSGTPELVRTDKQINFDWGNGSPAPQIHSDHFSVRWTGKIVPTATSGYRFSIMTDDGVRLYLDGKQMVDSWYDRGASADFFMVNLVADKQYDLRIEYYENVGSAFASLGWNVKASEDMEMQKAVETARKADVAVVAVGIVEGEGSDRAELNLPGTQEELITAVAATGVPTVVVLINGSAVTMNGWMDKVAAILEPWYPGEEGGNAIADVLFGNYNPGGKLPVTFPQAVGQCPLYYNLKPSGRGYDYVSMTGKPLFAFGYGLSYTKFDYTNLQITPKQIAPSEKIQVSLDVQNAGVRNGDEVVQLYVHDKVASVTRPLKELKAFRRVTLSPQEKKTVSFTLTPDDLSYLDKNLKYVLEPGTIEVMVGSSSADIRLKGSFEVIKK